MLLGVGEVFDFEVGVLLFEELFEVEALFFVDDDLPLCA